MIDKLMEAVLKKHGPLNITVDETDRYVISINGKPRSRAFSLGSCLINLLAEDKK